MSPKSGTHVDGESDDRVVPMKGSNKDGLPSDDRKNERPVPLELTGRSVMRPPWSSLAHRLAKRIEAGTVWGCHHLIDPALPFGGFKQSGIGREQAAAGIELYTETKSVLMKI